MPVIHFLLTASEPITHMMGTRGNVAILNRETVLSDGTPPVEVPVLSGNALRHALMREPAAGLLVDGLGIKGATGFQLADLLYHGGNLTGGKTLNGEALREFCRAVPFVRVFGGAFPGNIVPGILHVGRGLLACAETRDTILRLSGIDIGDNAPPCDECIGEYQYTRGCEDVAEDDRRMIYTGECVLRGAKFYCRVELADCAGELEVGCLFSALQAADNVIGGCGRAGHGLLNIEYSCEYTQEYVDACVAKYLAFVRDNATDAVALLNGLFAQEKAEKPQKKAKK